MTQDDPTPSAPLAMPDPADDPMVRAVGEILVREFTATSSDGLAVVVAGGDQRLRTVQFTRDDVSAVQAGLAALSAIGAALTAARQATVAAMRDLPGLDPILRRGLEGQA